MERCATCPHWQRARDLLTRFWEEGEKTMVCALTVDIYGERVSSESLATSYTDGGGYESALFTTAEFGCIQHPKNQ